MVHIDYSGAEHILTNYTWHLITLFVGVVAVTFVITAVRAWEDAVKLDQEERSTVERLLSPLASQMAPQGEIQVRQMRMQLARAGLRGDTAVKQFVYARAGALTAGAGIVFLLYLAQMPVARFLCGSIVILYFALKLPDIWLDSTIKGRQERIARALPAVTDLMVLCLDVGLSVEAAFERVTTEMQSMEPLMAEEAQMMVGEMSAGLTFPQAFKRMAERIGLEELITMARLITQASALGASITQALREYSEASFTKRMLALEEHAGKISAWLVMPLTACLLPACLLALAGPAVVILRNALKH